LLLAAAAAAKKACNNGNQFPRYAIRLVVIQPESPFDFKNDAHCTPSSPVRVVKTTFIWNTRNGLRSKPTQLKIGPFSPLL
jgi:hypothetical protein